MSGFGYLASQIVLCLLVAAFLGFLIGWFLRALRADRDAADAERDWSGRLERSESESRDLDAKLHSAEEEHAKTLGDRDKSLAALTADLEHRTEELETRSKELGAEQEKLGLLSADTDTLRGELEALRGQLAQCQESNTRHEAEVETLQGELTASRALANDRQETAARIAGLQATVTEQTGLREEAATRIAGLERALAACEEARDAQGAAAQPLAVVAPGATSEYEAQLAERDQQIQQLEQQLAAMDKLAGASLEPDDLQRIRGVGPVLEKMLNGIGVFTFRQIAAWDSADIAWAAAKLDAFTDRIERDQWVAQAREFYRETLAGES